MIDFTPPAPPAGLTAEQLRAWWDAYNTGYQTALTHMERLKEALQGPGATASEVRHLIGKEEA